MVMSPSSAATGLLSSRRLSFQGHWKNRLLHTSAIVLGYRGPMRMEGWIIRDNRPNKYPETEAERKAAALRYGMRPEDYKPHDPNTSLNQAVGDYPDLGEVNYAIKDPHEAYTDRWHRRNFGEPVHIHWIGRRADRITWTGVEAEAVDMKHVWHKILLFYGAIVLFAYWQMTAPRHGTLRWKTPMMPKQYPFDYNRARPHADPRLYPIVNYSFESANAPDKHHH